MSKAKKNNAREQRRKVIRSAQGKGINSTKLAYSIYADDEAWVEGKTKRPIAKPLKRKK